MQSLTTPRAVAHALSVALAPFVIVEEHPLVLVFVRLPPEFGPNLLLAFALAIKNSHEPPCLSRREQPKNTLEKDYGTFATQAHAPKYVVCPASRAI